jgi:protocatechuate 3,4-dioxygenase beta subunit
MENDDRQVGRILSRREVLALFGTAGAAILAGCVPGLSGSEQLASEPTQAVPSGSANMPTTVSTLEAPGATSTEALVDTGTLSACVVRPEMTEGPYFVDEMLNRSDIRSDPSTGEVKEGLPLQITMRVSQVGDACAPLEGAQVDIWHCDAMGIYSDTTDPGFNTVGQKFLRGYQVTDANGVAQFTTIYPGWYQGRTVHIHLATRQF